MEILLLILIVVLLLLVTYSQILVSIFIKPKGKKRIIKGHKKSDSKIVPQKFISAFKPISISTKDGTILNAYQYENKTFTHEWIICVHGYGGSLGNMIRYSEHFWQRDINILLIELRGHNDSKAKYSGLSYIDGYDLNLWIKRIIASDDKAKIILFGLSMGGTSSAMACGLEDIQNV